MIYTRFELTYNGQPENIGFLYGLSEVISDEEQIEELTERFEKDLKMHNAILNKHDLKENETASFFTEKGIKYFKKDIENIIEAIREKGWDVKTETINKKPFLYEDEYQVVILKPTK